MKLEQSPVCWGLTVGVVLAWSVSATAADVASCQAALFKAHQAYVIGVTKAKAKEARGRLTGGPLAAGLTAEKIAKARAKADALISAGCADVFMQQEADPNICPAASDLEGCLEDFVAKADTHTENVMRKVLRECSSNPTCDPKAGLPPPCVFEDNCYCYETAEEHVDCISPINCETAQPCHTSSECPPGEGCYVNTCCGPGGVCGRAACEP